jgi:hypothetical protein
MEEEKKKTHSEVKEEDLSKEEIEETIKTHAEYSSDGEYDQNNFYFLKKSPCIVLLIIC